MTALARARRRVVVCSAFVVAVAAVLSAAPAAGLPSIPSSKFKPAEECGCHPAFLETWSRSMHAQALTDPIYRYKLDEANRATKGALGPFCEGCHGTVAVMSGELGPGKPFDKLKGASADAVGCDMCHQAVGTAGKMGNVSLSFKADGTKRAQYKDAHSPDHKTAYSKFHETAEFCGSCHNVDHPGNGLHLEATYTEWKASPYAKQGIVCQDCHMTPGPGVSKPNPGRAAVFGVDREHIYTMTWAGGNTALGPKELAEERLQAAATVTVEAPRIVEPGETVRVKTTVTNVGAGHYLPTGLTEVRQMWLEVTATDRNGQRVLQERHEFGSVLRDAKGRHPVELWDAVAFQKDERIPPRKSLSQTWESPMPVNGPLKLSAVLYYRSAPEELAKAAKVKMEPTRMAEASSLVFGSEAQARDVAEEIKRDALRQASGEMPGFDMLVFVIVVGVLLVLIVGFGIWRSIKA